MALTSGQFVKAAQEDRVAVVTIDHPPVNALNAKTMEELGRTVDEIGAEATVKAVILTGAGAMCFVAGADLKEMSQVASPEAARSAAVAGQTVFRKIERLGKPVIAAINGICVGGGLELAMSCHLRVSGDRARFGQPEINLGIIPGWGGTQRLIRHIGRAKATEWILTGDLYSAQEAHRLGLINLLVPQDQVVKAAKDLARKVTAKGAVAVASALACLEAAALPIEQGTGVEADHFAKVFATEDAKEGVRAYLEKRQPQFKDR